MAQSRLKLHELLKTIDGPVDVYFQPKTAMEYPCIRYERGLPSDVTYADNVKYALKKGYTITVIDRDPDSLIPDQVEGLQHCEFDRFYKVDGLNHTVFQLFF